MTSKGALHVSGIPGTGTEGPQESTTAEEVAGGGSEVAVVGGVLVDTVGVIELDAEELIEEELDEEEVLKEELIEAELDKVMLSEELDEM